MTDRGKEFIDYVVRAIVQFPDEVEVTQTTDNLGVLITLKVNKDDMGKIIGKSGQTAKSLRILLRMMGAKTNERFNLKIIEPSGEEV
ncbi:MAG: KH domain-containing protein [Patescibacteria group bacterium]